jgi:peptidoglycan hydrolase CwlO-like protein
MLSNKELKKKIDELKTEIKNIKSDSSILKINIQQLHTDFSFITDLLKR